LEANLQEIKGIPSGAIVQCLQAFISCKILREVKEGESVRYEVAHDLLAKQVFARFSMEETARRKADGVYKIYREIGQQRTLTKEELETLSQYLRLLPPDEELKKIIATARLQVRREEETERVKLEEELKRQKELIEQREKGQRLRMWMSVGSALFAVAMLILAGFTYRYYLEAQEAKKELAQKGYEAQLTNCLTLKKDGKYDEAIEQLNLAEDFAKVLSPEKEATVRQLQQDYVEEKVTVKQAEEHLNKGELRPALELYQKASKISDYDTRLKGKVFEIERAIETEFEKSKQAGDAMLKAGEYRRATQNYEKALKLKPGEPTVEEKLRKSKALEQSPNF
jgi:tetratricopeptide (TPR) repeat protein